MSLSQRLDLRQSQQLVMTPQLQQAIKLLQMSQADLSAFVAEALESNPLLEMAEGAPPLPDTPSLGPEEPGVPDDSADRAAFDTQRTGGTYHDEDGMGAAERVAETPSLRDHLLAQINVDFPDPAERLIATSMIDLLDDAGYLPLALDGARAQLGASVEMFDAVVARLQNLDPCGIFARSLAECLAIQLREKNRLDPAMQTLLKNLPLVAKRDNAALCRLCGVDKSDLSGMLAEIRALNPKPASLFDGDPAPPVVPDVVLLPRPGGGWHVELNTDVLPRVLVNARYYAEIQGAAGNKQADKTYLSEHWQQANWLVKALHQRATTILKVATEIVRQQESFFTHGIQFLRPLILRDIAGAIEMHESTVSRVTQNKYILTPRGIFELKYFFSTALGTTGGIETVSAEMVRSRIKALIAEEDSATPLSDEGLSDLLRREGISIARRTVAKYRESLSLPPAWQRRRAVQES